MFLTSLLALSWFAISPAIGRDAIIKVLDSGYIGGCQWVPCDDSSWIWDCADPSLDVQDFTIRIEPDVFARWLKTVLFSTSMQINPSTMAITDTIQEQHLIQPDSSWEITFAGGEYPCTINICPNMAILNPLLNLSEIRWTPITKLTFAFEYDNPATKRLFDGEAPRIHFQGSIPTGLSCPTGGHGNN
ncbi:hypothetical protein VNI00_004844 [Paramarasmius palmivorus]|uniref:Uncharacterized protein n=1 Tax=Paramarasmius palmivorus TaxID=297713 RepID=A0AAW0DKI3_9AGAR